MTYACYYCFPILFILIFIFYALIILFPLLLGFILCPSFPQPLLWYKLPPQCLRFEFQNNADVVSEEEASFMCIEARHRAV